MAPGFRQGALLGLDASAQGDVGQTFSLSLLFSRNACCLLGGGAAERLFSR